MIELDWNAEIINSVSMMGVNLGTDKDEIYKILKEHSIIDNGIVSENYFVIKFKNSPELIVNETNNCLNFIDKASMTLYGANPNNHIATLTFNTENQLATIAVWATLDSSNYKGKFHDAVGLGESPQKLLKTGLWEFDDGNELFYSADNKFPGIEFGGVAPINQMPEQTISFIIIFSA